MAVAKPETLECPNCGSLNAVVAYRRPAEQGNYCPDCEHCWNTPANPFLAVTPLVART